MNIYFDSLIPFGMASEPLTLYSWRIKAGQKESATLPQRRAVVLSEARPASSTALLAALTGPANPDRAVADVDVVAGKFYRRLILEPEWETD